MKVTQDLLSYEFFKLFQLYFKGVGLLRLFNGLKGHFLSIINFKPAYLLNIQYLGIIRAIGLFGILIALGLLVLFLLRTCYKENC